LNEWMNERITISFVVFGAAVVYRPYGRLHREKKDWEKKVCVNVSPLHHRPYNTERRSIVWENLII
jgi:hypothetical protein